MRDLPFSLIVSATHSPEDIPRPMSSGQRHGDAKVELAYNPFTRVTLVKINPLTIDMNDFRVPLGCVIGKQAHFAWDERIEIKDGVIRYIDPEGGMPVIEGDLMLHPTQGNFTISGQGPYMLTHKLTGMKRVFDKDGHITQIVNPDGKAIKFEWKDGEIDSIEFENRKKLIFKHQAQKTEIYLSDGCTEKLLQTLFYREKKNKQIDRIVFGKSGYEVRCIQSNNTLSIKQSDKTRITIKTSKDNATESIRIGYESAFRFAHAKETKKTTIRNAAIRLEITQDGEMVQSVRLGDCETSVTGSKGRIEEIRKNKTVIEAIRFDDITGLPKTHRTLTEDVIMTRTKLDGYQNAWVEHITDSDMALTRRVYIQGRLAATISAEGRVCTLEYTDKKIDEWRFVNHCPINLKFDFEALLAWTREQSENEQAVVKTEITLDESDHVLAIQNGECKAVTRLDDFGAERYRQDNLSEKTTERDVMLRPTKVLDEAGELEEIHNYRRNRHTVSIKEKGGTTTKTESIYNAAGRIETQHEQGKRTQMGYQGLGLPKLTSVIADGVVHRHHQWHRGSQLIASLNEAGLLTVHTYEQDLLVATAQYDVVEIKKALVDLSLDALQEKIKAMRPQGCVTIYNDKLRPAFEIDAMGYITEYEYNARGKVIRSSRFDEPCYPAVALNFKALEAYCRDRSGRHEYFLYDRDDLQVAAVDHYGGVTEMRRDGLGRIIDRIERALFLKIPKLSKKLEDYEIQDLVRSIEASTGGECDRHTRTFYLNKTLPRYEVDPAGYVVAYEYNNKGQCIQKRQYLVAIELVANDSLKEIEHKLAGLKYDQITYKRDSHNRITEEVLPNGRVTTYTYFRDTNEYISKISRAPGEPSRKWFKRYHHMGHCVQSLNDRVIGAIEAETGTEFDFNWCEAYARRGTRIQHNGMENPYCIVNEIGQASWIIYDSANRPIVEISDSGIVVEYTYEARQKHPCEKRLHAAKLVMSDMIEMLRCAKGYPDQSLLKHIHNNRGPKIDSIWQYRFDALRRLEYTVDPEKRDARHRRNAHHEITRSEETLSKGRQRITDNDYPLLEHMTVTSIRENESETSETTHRNPFGDVMHIIDGNGQRWGFIHDKLANVIGIEQPDGSSIVQVWDVYRRLLQRSHPTVDTDNPVWALERHFEENDSIEIVIDHLNRTSRKVRNAHQEIIAHRSNAGLETAIVRQHDSVELIRKGLGFLQRSVRQINEAGFTRSQKNAAGIGTSYSDFDGRQPRHVEKSHDGTIISKIDREFNQHQMMAAEVQTLHGQAKSATLEKAAGYNKSGQLGHLITDPKNVGLTHKTEQDAKNRLIESSHFASSHLALDHPEQFKTVYGHNVFDSLMEKRIMDLQGGKEDRAYRIIKDRVGNVTTRISPKGARTELVYDGMRRLRFEINAEGGVVEWKYQKGHKHPYQKIVYANRYKGEALDDNHAKRLQRMQEFFVQQKDAMQHLIEYRYKADALLEYSFEHGRLKHFEHDVHGEVSAATRYKKVFGQCTNLHEAVEASQKMRHEHICRTITIRDEYGRTLFKVDADGIVTAFEYDPRFSGIKWLSKRVYHKPLKGVEALNATLEALQAVVESQLSGVPCDLEQNVFNLEGKPQYSIDKYGYLTANEYLGENRLERSKRYKTPIEEKPEGHTRADIEAFLERYRGDIDLSEFNYDTANRITEKIVNGISHHYKLNCISQIVETYHREQTLIDDYDGFANKVASTVDKLAAVIITDDLLKKDAAIQSHLYQLQAYQMDLFKVSNRFDKDEHGKPQATTLASNIESQDTSEEARVAYLNLQRKITYCLNLLDETVAKCYPDARVDNGKVIEDPKSDPIDHREVSTRTIRLNHSEPFCEIDEANHPTYQIYNEAGLVEYLIDPNGAVTHFEYDGVKQIACQIKYGEALASEVLSEVNQTLLAKVHDNTYDFAPLNASLLASCREHVLLYAKHPKNRVNHYGHNKRGIETTHTAPATVHVVPEEQASLRLNRSVLASQRTHKVVDHRGLTAETETSLVAPSEDAVYQKSTKLVVALVRPRAEICIDDDNYATYREYDHRGDLVHEIRYANTLSQDQIERIKSFGDAERIRLLKMEVAKRRPSGVFAYTESSLYETYDDEIIFKYDRHRRLTREIHTNHLAAYRTAGGELRVRSGYKQVKYHNDDANKAYQWRRKTDSTWVSYELLDPKGQVMALLSPEYETTAGGEKSKRQLKLMLPSVHGEKSALIDAVLDSGDIKIKNGLPDLSIDAVCQLGMLLYRRWGYDKENKAGDSDVSVKLMAYDNRGLLSAEQNELGHVQRLSRTVNKHVARSWDFSMKAILDEDGNAKEVLLRSEKHYRYNSMQRVEAVYELIHMHMAEHFFKRASEAEKHAIKAEDQGKVDNRDLLKQIYQTSRKAYIQNAAELTGLPPALLEEKNLSYQKKEHLYNLFNEIFADVVQRIYFDGQAIGMTNVDDSKPRELSHISNYDNAGFSYRQQLTNGRFELRLSDLHGHNGAYIRSLTDEFNEVTPDDLRHLFEEVSKQCIELEARGVHQLAEQINTAKGQPLVEVSEAYESRINPTRALQQLVIDHTPMQIAWEDPFDQSYEVIITFHDDTTARAALKTLKPKRVNGRCIVDLAELDEDGFKPGQYHYEINYKTDLQKNAENSIARIEDQINAVKTTAKRKKQRLSKVLKASGISLSGLRAALSDARRELQEIKQSNQPPLRQHKITGHFTRDCVMIELVNDNVIRVSHRLDERIAAIECHYQDGTKETVYADEIDVKQSKFKLDDKRIFAYAVLSKLNTLSTELNPTIHRAPRINIHFSDYPGAPNDKFIELTLDKYKIPPGVDKLYFEIKSFNYLTNDLDVEVIDISVDGNNSKSASSKKTYPLGIWPSSSNNPIYQVCLKGLNKQTGKSIILSEFNENWHPQAGSHFTFYEMHQGQNTPMYRYLMPPCYAFINCKESHVAVYENDNLINVLPVLTWVDGSQYICLNSRVSLDHLKIRPVSTRQTDNVKCEAIKPQMRSREICVTGFKFFTSPEPTAASITHCKDSTPCIRVNEGGFNPGDVRLVVGPNKFIYMGFIHIGRAYKYDHKYSVETSHVFPKVNPLEVSDNYKIQCKISSDPELWAPLYTSAKDNDPKTFHNASAIVLEGLPDRNDAAIKTYIKVRFKVNIGGKSEWVYAKEDNAYFLPVVGTRAAFATRYAMGDALARNLPVGVYDYAVEVYHLDAKEVPRDDRAFVADEILYDRLTVRRGQVGVPMGETPLKEITARNRLDHTRNRDGLPLEIVRNGCDATSLSYVPGSDGVVMRRTAPVREVLGSDPAKVQRANWAEHGLPEVFRQEAKYGLCEGSTEFPDGWSVYTMRPMHCYLPDEHGKIAFEVYPDETIVSKDHNAIDHLLAYTDRRGVAYYFKLNGKGAWLEHWMKGETEDKAIMIRKREVYSTGDVKRDPKDRIHRINAKREPMAVAMADLPFEFISQNLGPNIRLSRGADAVINITLLDASKRAIVDFDSQGAEINFSFSDAKQRLQYLIDNVGIASIYDYLDNASHPSKKRTLSKLSGEHGKILVDGEERATPGEALCYRLNSLETVLAVTVLNDGQATYRTVNSRQTPIGSVTIDETTGDIIQDFAMVRNPEDIPVVIVNSQGIFEHYLNEHNEKIRDKLYVHVQDRSGMPQWCRKDLYHEIKAGQVQRQALVLEAGSLVLAPGLSQVFDYHRATQTLKTSVRTLNYQYAGCKTRLVTKLSRELEGTQRNILIQQVEYYSDLDDSGWKILSSIDHVLYEEVKHYLAPELLERHTNGVGRTTEATFKTRDSGAEPHEQTIQTHYKESTGLEDSSGPSNAPRQNEVKERDKKNRVTVRTHTEKQHDHDDKDKLVDVVTEQLFERVATSEGTQVSAITSKRSKDGKERKSHVYHFANGHLQAAKIDVEDITKAVRYRSDATGTILSRLDGENQKHYICLDKHLYAQVSNHRTHRSIEMADGVQYDPVSSVEMPRGDDLCGEPIYYHAQGGETLTEILPHYDIDSILSDEIARANGLNANHVCKAGEFIYIPQFAELNLTGHVKHHATVNTQSMLGDISPVLPKYFVYHHSEHKSRRHNLMTLTRALEVAAAVVSVLATAGMSLPEVIAFNAALTLHTEATQQVIEKNAGVREHFSLREITHHISKQIATQLVSAGLEQAGSAAMAKLFDVDSAAKLASATAPGVMNKAGSFKDVFIKSLSSAVSDQVVHVMSHGDHKLDERALFSQFAESLAMETLSLYEYEEELDLETGVATLKYGDEVGTHFSQLLRGTINAGLGAFTGKVFDKRRDFMLDFAHNLASQIVSAHRHAEADRKARLDLLAKKKAMEGSFAKIQSGIASHDSEGDVYMTSTHVSGFALDPSEIALGASRDLFDDSDDASQALSPYIRRGDLSRIHIGGSSHIEGASIDGVGQHPSFLSTHWDQLKGFGEAALGLGIMTVSGVGEALSGGTATSLAMVGGIYGVDHLSTGLRHVFGNTHAESVSRYLFEATMGQHYGGMTDDILLWSPLGEFVPAPVYRIGSKAFKYTGGMAVKSLTYAITPYGEGAIAYAAHQASSVVSHGKYGLAKYGFFRERIYRDINLGDELHHTVTSPWAAKGVLNKVDMKFLNWRSRFHRAFYTSNDQATTLYELEHHGAVGTHTIRFTLDLKEAKILDLRDPHVAKIWRYEGGDGYTNPKAISKLASRKGYNMVIYNSERGPMVNAAVLKDFDKLLSPRMVVPTPSFQVIHEEIAYVVPRF